MRIGDNRVIPAIRADVLVVFVVALCYGIYRRRRASRLPPGALQQASMTIRLAAGWLLARNRAAATVAASLAALSGFGVEL